MKLKLDSRVLDSSLAFFPKLAKYFAHLDSTSANDLARFVYNPHFTLIPLLLRSIMPILPKDNHCCGCSACFSACPHDSITMAQDFCGFYYPKVDPSTCTECKLCEIACPTLPYLDFAPYDQVRKKSRFPYDVKSHSLDSRGIYVHFSWHKPSFYSKPLESSALDSSMDCHAPKSARNDRKADSRQTCSRLDLGFSLSAWDSRIVDEKGLLCERSQGRILGVCNCSTREAIHDLSRKAESTKQQLMPLIAKAS